MSDVRVLIVDDDVSTRSGLSELLTNAGYKAYGVGTFEEGLAALRNDRPDLLIADIRLGSFNGLHLLMMAPNHLPVIITTGFDDRMLEREARKYGAEYVLKPLSPSTFVQLVRRCLERRGPRVRRKPRPDDQAQFAGFSRAP